MMIARRTTIPTISQIRIFMSYKQKSVPSLHLDITGSVFAHLPPHLLADLVGTAAELLGCTLEIVRLVPEVVEIVTTSFRKHDVLLHYANGLVELLYVVSS